jgi:hypothetical protein
MLTTTTETDISVNYRWGEMAFFNADAGLEYGKNVLSAYALRDGDLINVLPPQRGPGTDNPDMTIPPTTDSDACPDPGVAGCRDYQYSIVQGTNTVYIGRVLRDLTGQPVQYDFRQPVPGDTRGDIDNDNVTDIMGTITLWVRRPITGDHDEESNDLAILTAEGTAPNYEFAAGTSRPGSVRRIEMTVSLGATSGVAGTRYSDVTRASDPNATIQEGWRTIDRFQ